MKKEGLYGGIIFNSYSREDLELAASFYRGQQGSAVYLVGSDLFKNAM